MKKIFEPRHYQLNGYVQLPDSMMIRVENSSVYVNNKHIDLNEILMNIFISKMRLDPSSSIKPNLILKMEMSPGEKWAIEVEDTGSEVITVLSAVESEITLVQQYRDVLFCYSGSLQLDSDNVEIQWSDDAVRSAVFFKGVLVTVYDLANKRMIKSLLNGNDLDTVPLQYFETGIVGNVGQVISI